MLCILTGIPESEWPTIARISSSIGLALGITIKEDLPEVESALAELYGYAEALIADRQANPRDDLVTRLVEANMVDAAALVRFRRYTLELRESNPTPIHMAYLTERITEVLVNVPYLRVLRLRDERAARTYGNTFLVDPADIHALLGNLQDQGMLRVMGNDYTVEMVMHIRTGTPVRELLRLRAITKR